MVVVVLGPGGVGKGTVVSRLIEVDPSLHLSRSWTTRPRRPGEPEDAYTFVDRDRFLEHLAAGGFLEHDDFLGNLYGTPVPDDTLDGDLLLEINVQGAEQVLGRVDDPLVILLVAPSPEVQEARLRARGDTDEHVRMRLDLAHVEEEKGRRVASAVVVNDDLARAVGEVAGIIADRRRRA
jgi:guanylate kinase